MVFVELGVIFLAFLVLSETARRMIRRLVNLSRHFGLSEFSISFLVVGGVSIIPELVIGLESALSQSSQLGLGIVFGSNVADLSLVLGLGAGADSLFNQSGGKAGTLIAQKFGEKE